jgi:hypothetical protein
VLGLVAEGPVAADPPYLRGVLVVGRLSLEVAWQNEEWPVDPAEGTQRHAGERPQEGGAGQGEDDPGLHRPVAATPALRPLFVFTSRVRFHFATEGLRTCSDIPVYHVV